ncbi:hypothetical protein JCM10908_000375 [Rhodotorula pacifica]|uniref:uncharacterized protein n=1 Tax=Rhodotorula pacifica TaxID=1495444 RepID=UPI0031748097
MVTGVNSLVVKLASGRVVLVHQALLLPGIAANLLSSLQLYDNHGMTTTFAKHAILSRDGSVIATGTRLRKHFSQLDGAFVPPAAAKDATTLLASGSLPLARSDRQTAAVLELVHSDVLTVNVPLQSGRRYGVEFGAFQRFKAAIENESGKRIQRLRSDKERRVHLRQVQ